MKYLSYDILPHIHSISSKRCFRTFRPVGNERYRVRARESEEQRSGSFVIFSLTKISAHAALDQSSTTVRLRSSSASRDSALPEMNSVMEFRNAQTARMSSSAVRCIRSVKYESERERGTKRSKANAMYKTQI